MAIEAVDRAALALAAFGFLCLLVRVALRTRRGMERAVQTAPQLPGNDRAQFHVGPRRLVAWSVYALAATAAVLASAGVAAPAHRMPPGTPLFHNVSLGAYRYGFLLEPLTVSDSLSPEMAALHRLLALAGVPVVDMPGMGEHAFDAVPTFEASGLSPAQDLAVQLALLVIVVPLLPRPSRHPIGRVAVTPRCSPQWRPASPSIPPRPPFVPATAA